MEGKIAFLISQIDDCVKHIFREHNQEADHWTNLGADGQRRFMFDKGSNTEKRKMVRDFWDGSSKINGRSGCGVVIKGADKDKWITISKIAVPLGMCSAMTAEVVERVLIMWVSDNCSFVSEEGESKARC